MNYRGYEVESDNGRFTVWVGELPALDSPSLDKAKKYVDEKIKREHKERANFKFAD